MGASDVTTETTNRLTAAVRGALGDELVALVLYGSGTNVLILVRTVSAARLQALAGAVGAWQDAGHTPPLILTVSEWASTRDVFALEHADIAAKHVVLAGALPVGTPATADDLRRQLEYEAMGALIHLRQGMVACRGDAAVALQLLVASKGTVLALFRGLRRLDGHEVPASPDALIRAVADTVGFDPAPFLALVEHAAGTRVIPSGDVHGVLHAYHDGLKRFMAHVDARVHPDAPAVD